MARKLILVAKKTGLRSQIGWTKGDFGANKDIKKQNGLIRRDVHGNIRVFGAGDPQGRSFYEREALHVTLGLNVPISRVTILRGPIEMWSINVDDSLFLAYVRTSFTSLEVI